jgi:predicted regulator of Ras-like GTPase activity (Roadblock/LC7/MglB family)
VLAFGFLAFVGLRSLAGTASADPAAPNPGHSWSQIGDLPGTLVTRSVFSTTTVDDPANQVGNDSSATIGTDGLPVISYRDASAGTLWVAHCGNPSCSAGNTLTKVDDPPVNVVGGYTSITIGADGLPVISYYDDTADALKVAHCSTASCTATDSITTVDDPANHVGQHSSITIGADGLPVISYYDDTAGTLWVAHCGNPSCSAANTLTKVDDPPVNVVGGYSSITIGADGLPVISYFDDTADALKVAHCSNASCSATDSITTVDDPANTVGQYSTSITIGADGLPVISYYDGTDGTLWVAHCGNPSCSAANTLTKVDDPPVNAVGGYSSITIGADGLPVIGYKDGTAKSLKVAHCGNASCSAANTVTTVDDPANQVGTSTSIAIGTDGLPVISYTDETADALKVAHCSNRFCVPYHRPR